MLKRLTISLLLPVAAAVVPAAAQETASSDDDEAVVGQPGTTAEEEVDEVVVTGEKTPVTRDVGAPVEVLDAAQMEQTSRSTMADFLRVDVPQNITQDSGIQNSGFQGRMQGNRNSAVSLRGLGKENNLLLFNGERLVDYAVPDSDGWRSGDVNATIPRVILDRTEVILDGGSALYGTDAISGVVDLIPNYSFRGIKFSVRSQHFEQKIDRLDTTMGVAFGFGNDRTSVVGAVDYQHVDNVTNVEIGQRLSTLFKGDTERMGYHTFGYRDYTGIAGGGSISQADPLCGNQAAFETNDAVGEVSSRDGFATCAQGLGETANKTIDTNNVTTFVGVDHEFSDRLSARLSLSYNDSEYGSIYHGNRHFTEWRSDNYDDALIPADHPGVQYYEQEFGGWDNGVGWVPGPVTQIINYRESRRAKHSSIQWRTGLGMDYRFSDAWRLELRGSYGVSQVNVHRLAVIPENAVNALQGLGGPDCDPATGVPGQGDCEWFNPFMSSGLPDAEDLGLRNSRKLLDWIMPMDSRYNEATLSSFQSLLIGDLDSVRFDGGPLEMVAGYEFRREREGVDYDELLNEGVYDDQNGARLIDYKVSQDVHAFMLQGTAPVTDRLTLQLATRYEDFERGYATFNPKLGVQWWLSQDFILRATLGTSYKAPSLSQTHASVYDQASWLNVGNPLDPYYQQGIFSGSAFTSNFNKVISPNPKLKPQESTNWSLGFNWLVNSSLDVNAGLVGITLRNIIEIKSASEMLRSPDCHDGIAADGHLRGTDGIGYTALGGYGNTVGVLIPTQGDGTTCFDVDPATGLPLRVHISPQNLYKREIVAMDAGAKWTAHTDVGTFTLRPNFSVLLKYTNQDAKDEEVVDWVGKRTFLGSGFAKYRLNMPLSWRRDRHTITLTTRWTSGLEREPPIPTARPYPSFVYWDLNWQMQLNEHVRTSFFANNVTNKFPIQGASIYPRNGRRLGFQLTAAFGG